MGTKTAGQRPLIQPQTHEDATDKVVGLALKPDVGWSDWLSTRLAGGQGLSGGPGIITCEWLSLLCSSPNEGVGELTQAQRGGPDCHWGACLLWFVINYCMPGRETSVSAATSSVKHSRAPAGWRDAAQVVLLTALWFGCSLVELELGEQGAILLVLLRAQTQRWSISSLQVKRLHNSQGPFQVTVCVLTNNILFC